MNNIAILEYPPTKLGRPTNEEVRLKQDLHKSSELLKDCHFRVVALENRIYLLSNALQENKIKTHILARNLEQLSRV